MTKNLFAALVGFACTLFLWESRSLGQNLSGTSLSVSGTGSISVLTSGTATIGDLAVSGTTTLGTLDIAGNAFAFGSSPANALLPGVSVIYTGDTVSSPAAMNLMLTGSSAAWNWQQSILSGTSISGVTTMMSLDASNGLVLYGGTNANIVLTPVAGGTSRFATAVRFEGTDNQMPNQTLASSNSILTRGLADQRYVFNTANGAYPSLALGIGASASGNYDVVMGIYVSGSNDWCTVVGNSSSSSGPGGTVVGNMSSGSGWSPTALGSQAIANGYAPTAVGNQVSAGTYATAVGCSSSAGTAATSVGMECNSSYNATAVGIKCKANGYYSTAVGYGGVVDGWGAIAIGTSGTASGGYSVVLGHNITAQGRGQIVVGQYNVPQGDMNNWFPNDELFTVGNGTDEAHPSNAFSIYKNGNVLITGSTAMNGNAKVSGTLALSGSGALVLPDGTVLSSSNTLRSIVSSGTALAISGTVPTTQIAGLSPVATSGNYTSLTGLPTLPTNNTQLANGAGYITSSGTAAYALASNSAASLSGTIQATQVAGLSTVATSGSYGSLTGAPTNVSSFTNDAGYVAASGTASGITLSGTTTITDAARITGGLVVTGTASVVTSGTTTKTKIVASGANQLVLIPEQGDLSMGDYTDGSQPQ